MTELLLLGALILGVALVLAAGIAIGAIGRQRRAGRLVWSDAAGSSGAVLRSDRFRLSGRPDEIRALPDGRWVPVEIKRRPAPLHGVPISHAIQVAAYCLLIEEQTGRSPPYGVLRYGDHAEFRVAWTPQRRESLLELRASLERPYRGEATPSPARCRRCGWREVCDRSAA